MLPLRTHEIRETVFLMTFRAPASPPGGRRPRPHARPQAPAPASGASANPSIMQEGAMIAARYEMARDAITGYVESLIEDGEAVPTEEELIECRLTRSNPAYPLDRCDPRGRDRMPSRPARPAVGISGRARTPT
jgi:hypothetical protein